ncbi:Uncharacterized protein conserved in bacteria [Acidipropionibacterium jensenii]|uniref:Uncharacterized protein conserved in bacteria n=1 Tax=Acidipropionibacterium jensenii TaxID=1749 RepID=A0A448P048_9ACTN|nr:DUF2252 domain-containing protein [Acidipropionibacterium jensenii]VEI03568.1 Uncharacterized protein conserved in bacteria [Acidipropionibacterium jensenii]
MSKVVSPAFTPTPPPSFDDRIHRGREARESTTWDGVAQLSTTDRDPIGILSEQNEDRLQSLVPLRTERMSVSPFTFYRGTAALMASDLARTPHSGILVASCGDAHVSNFGFYASPQRSLVFDLNDFDESAWAPWEWDLKRLVASIVIAGRSTSRKKAVVRQTAVDTIASYLDALRAAVHTSPTERYFTHFDAEQHVSQLSKRSREVLKDAIGDAEKRTSARVVRRLTAVAKDGHRRFIEQPPVLTPIDDAAAAAVADGLRQYQDSASEDIHLLMLHYRLADVARRVVGVGSVGTRCFLALFEDGDGHHQVLQVKEAGRSVLEQYGGIAQPPALQDTMTSRGQGARVVGLQRILQGLSDPFLGYIDQGSRGYYVRQFHDMKGNIDMDTLKNEPFNQYGTACGRVLARAHAQSPEAVEILGFAGHGKKLTEAILSWSLDYAKLSESDFDLFTARS